MDDLEDYDLLQTTVDPYGENSTFKPGSLDAPGGESEIMPIINSVTTSIPFIPLGLGIIIVTVFGIIGNLLSAIVLSRKRLRSSYSVLTLGLTFVDTVYLCMKFLRYGIASLFFHYDIVDVYLKTVLPLTGPYLRALTFTAHTASTYFTMAIAIDRYIAICRPVTARKYCTRNRATIISLLVIIWAFALNATRWLEFKSVEFNGNDGSVVEGNSTASTPDMTKNYYVMEITELRQDSTYREVYIFWIYLVFMFILPFVSLSILNFCIFVGLRRMVRDETVLTSTQRRDTSFSLMLIGVVVVFLLCNVDYLVLDILEYCGIEFSEFWNHLGNFLLTLNSAVNFIIYCVCGWKFRQELWQVIRDVCPCLKQHGSHDIVSATDECQWVKDTMNNMDLQTIPRVSLSKATSKNHQI